MALLVIGILQAIETLKLLTNYGKIISGKVLFYDAMSTEFRTINLMPDPNCEICQSIKNSANIYTNKSNICLLVIRLANFSQTMAISTATNHHMFLLRALCSVKNDQVNWPDYHRQSPYW